MPPYVAQVVRRPKATAMLLQMPQPFGSRPLGITELRVEAPEVARKLLEPATLRALSPFVGEARTASEVARELELPLNTLLYQVRGLLKLGLLEVEREACRAGRAVKHYRAVAEAFFLPYTVTPAETPEVLLAQEHASRQGRLIRGLVEAAYGELDPQGEHVWGVRVGLEAGRLTVRNAIGPESPWNFLDADAPALVDLWAEDVTLDFAEAKALQKELCELLGRYRAKRGRQGYIVRLGMAPLPRKAETR